MSMRFALLALSAAALAQATAAQPSLAFLEGASPTNLRLSVVDEATPSNPRRTVLEGLQILPLEITNRTTQLSLRLDRPRVLVEQGVPRVELGGNGRLLHYSRRAAGRFGFVWIRPDGEPIVVLELAGAAEPFADRFGVAPDSRHAAVVTAAGEVYAVRLDGASYPSTGTPARRLEVPGAVRPVSVCVGPTHAFFHTEDQRIWRCALEDGALPEDVTPGASGTVRLAAEMAPSGDGTVVVFLFGPPELSSLYLVRSQGDAERLPPPPAEYAEPGYLPESSRGPRLLLSDDGSRLLYTDATNHAEIYLLDTTGATAAVHVTASANFEPYIGTVILPAFTASILVAAIGDPPGFDWFAASTGSAGVVNLTGTSSGPPFYPGTLVPTAAYATSRGDVLAEETDDAGGKHLRRVDPGAGTSSLVFSDLTSPLQTGRAPQSANLLVATAQGDRIVSPALVPLLAAPAGVTLSPDAQLGGGVSVLTASMPSLRAALFLLPGGGLLALPPDPGLRQVVATPGGGVLLNGTQVLYARPGYSAVLAGEPASIRVVLSHAQ